MPENWQSVEFETFPAGVSSAVDPVLLPISQTAWMKNGKLRGGKPATRPNLHQRLFLPPGLVQGVKYFGVQGGMAVVSIDGRIYRIRIQGNSFNWTEIPLPWINNPTIKQVYMQQTVESLVIQDGQSSPIIYNGSTARRAGATEVPIGRQMAYGNGRLWVAINLYEVVAGDIRTRAPGSELFFTETNYLSGGGALTFSRGVTGMAFIPTTGTTDYGALLILGQDYADSIRADISQRDLWSTYPGFVTNVLRNTGAGGHWSLCEVNQDLYWRDGEGGIRSLRAALVAESGFGNSPVSREVSRLVNYDSTQLLSFCSAIKFDNRLLMTSSPYLNVSGGVSWRDLIALDFSPQSVMLNKAYPAYDGQWQGAAFQSLFQGKFNGQDRAFAISSDPDGNNRLWEFGTLERDDITLVSNQDLVTEGTACFSEEVAVPITSQIELPAIKFNDSKVRKRLERFDLWLTEVDGEVSVQVYWRADNAQKWLAWDEVQVCAATTDPATSEPHTWKNLVTQARPQIKSFTIPQEIYNDITHVSTCCGFQFQVRIVWTGVCKIFRAMMHATALEDPQFAFREWLESSCKYEDITGNDINYEIELFEGCPTFFLSDGSGTIDCGDSIDFGTTVIGDPVERQLIITNDGVSDLVLGDVLITSGEDNYSLDEDYSGRTVAAGESLTITITLDADTNGVNSGILSLQNNSTGNCFISLTGVVQGLSVYSLSWRGNVQWYGFRPYDWTGDFGDIPERYLIKSAAGNNQQQLGGGFECLKVNTVVGTVLNSFSGSVHISEIDGSQDGQMRNIQEFSVNSRFCNGSSYLYTGIGGLTRNHYGETIEGVWGTNPAFIFAVGPVIGHLVRRWGQGPDLCPGYLQSYCGGAIGSTNHAYRMYETLSRRMKLSEAVAAGGAPQIEGSFRSVTQTYNNTTGEQNAEVSTLVFNYPRPAVNGVFILTATFEVTPNGGGPSETITVTQYVDVGVGGTLVDQEMDVPMRVGYTYQYVSASVLDMKQDGDDFEAQSDGFVGGLNPPSYILGDGWPESPSFAMPQPGTFCGTDWEGVDEGPYAIDFSGYYWAANGSFVQRDGQIAGDDFESYTVGYFPQAGGGLGWNGLGFFLTVNYNVAADNFEYYFQVYGSGVVTNWGTRLISVFDFGQFLFLPAPGQNEAIAAWGSYWSAYGYTYGGEFNGGVDSLQSYSDGSISSLPDGSGWAGSGSFFTQTPQPPG